MTNNEYKSAFFITPSYILDLPGLTLTFLRIYETIFQFWNHGKECFLSEAAICERAKCKRSQYYEALNYFEKHNELIRVFKNGKRYLTRPQVAIKTERTEFIQQSGGADYPRPEERTTPSVGADYNIKKVNKENTTTTQQQFSSFSSEDDASPIELITVFQEELPENPADCISKAGNGIDKAVLARITEFRREWKAITKKPLSIINFRRWLICMKDECPGFCEGIQPRSQKRNGIIHFLDWRIIAKSFNGEIY